jgi:hypothetical protein
MSFQIIYIFRRVDESIPWHYIALADIPKKKPYLEAQEKFKVSRTVLELDPLTLEVTQYWESQALYEEYKQLPAVVKMQKEFDLYNRNNGVSKEVKILHT